MVEYPDKFWGVFLLVVHTVVVSFGVAWLMEHSFWLGVVVGFIVVRWWWRMFIKPAVQKARCEVGECVVKRAKGRGAVYWYCGRCGKHLGSRKKIKEGV